MVSQRLDCCSHAKRAAAKRGGLRSRGFRLLSLKRVDTVTPVLGAERKQEQCMAAPLSAAAFLGSR